MPVPFVACMALVASIYHLPPRVLPSIHAVEGGRVGGVSANTNGTEDLGVMQVNTVWLPALSAYTRTDVTVVRHRLVNDACYNIAAAGAILRNHLNETRGDLMLAIGNYHSRTPLRNQAYQAKVMRSAARMFALP